MKSRFENVQTLAVLTTTVSFTRIDCTFRTSAHKPSMVIHYLSLKLDATCITILTCCRICKLVTCILLSISCDASAKCLTGAWIRPCFSSRHK